MQPTPREIRHAHNDHTTIAPGETIAVVGKYVQSVLRAGPIEDLPRVRHPVDQVTELVGRRLQHELAIELTGLYWHFVDLVWVFVFTFFYLV